IKLIDDKHDIARRQNAKYADFEDESVPIPLLQRIVKAVAPLVQQNIDPDQRQFNDDHRGEQRPAGQSVLGTEIGCRDPPNGRQRRADVARRLSLLERMTYRPEDIQELSRIKL